jgi:hypothetical protein
LGDWFPNSLTYTLGQAEFSVLPHEVEIFTNAPVSSLFFPFTARIPEYLMKLQDFRRRIQLLRQTVTAYSTNPSQSPLYWYNMNLLRQRIEAWLNTEPAV